MFRSDFGKKVGLASLTVFLTSRSLILFTFFHYFILFISSNLPFLLVCVNFKHTTTLCPLTKIMQNNLGNVFKPFLALWVFVGLGHCPVRFFVFLPSAGLHSFLHTQKRTKQEKRVPPVSFAPVCYLCAKLKIISNKSSNTFMIFCRFAQRAKE